MNPNYRDRQIADEASAERDTMCCASGCPNRWSVDMGSGRMCSAHAWSSPRSWPQVTIEQQDAAIRRQNKPRPTPKQAEKVDPREVLARLRSVFVSDGESPAAKCARRLREIGKTRSLTLAQRQMLAACEPREPA